MILVNAGGKTYTHFIYRVLASYNVNSLNGGPQQSECQEDAVVSLLFTFLIVLLTTIGFHSEILNNP